MRISYPLKAKTLRPLLGLLPYHKCCSAARGELCCRRYCLLSLSGITQRSALKLSRAVYLLRKALLQFQLMIFIGLLSAFGKDFFYVKAMWNTREYPFSCQLAGGGNCPVVPLKCPFANQQSIEIAAGILRGKNLTSAIIHLNLIQF